jgi:PAS domain-containing protein
LKAKAGESARTDHGSGLAVLDAIREQNGELLGFVKITRDMTERREAQQRLLESEMRFRQLVEGVVDYAIFHLDPNGIISTCNTGAQRIKRLCA